MTASGGGIKRRTIAGYPSFPFGLNYPEFPDS